MKLKKDDKAINTGEQTPEVLSKNLKILEKDVIKFSVKNMFIAQEVVIEETGISFKPDEHKSAIGVIRPKCIDEENVRQSYREIDKTVNILSLLYGVGDWKLRLPVNLETSMARIIAPKDLEAVDNAFKSISNKMDTEEMEVYFRALEWYRYGINSKILFNRFLAFYNAIELFSGGYCYSKHRSEIRRSPTEKDNCIKEYFENRSIKSISDIKRKDINECYEECLQTGAKSKIKFAFKTVFDGDKDKISAVSNKFFEEEVNFQKIRNDIAHGNISEYKEEDRTLVEKNLSEIQYMTREFLRKIIS